MKAIEQQDDCGLENCRITTPLHENSALCEAVDFRLTTGFCLDLPFALEMNDGGFGMRLCTACLQLNSFSSRVLQISGVLALLVFCPDAVRSQAFSDTVYVSLMGHDTNSGQSPQQAVRMVENGLTKAAQNGDKVLVLVGAGTYQFEDFPLTLPSNVTLRGDGLPTQVVIDASGGTPERVFNLLQTRNGVIENFTLRNGSAQGATGDDGNGGAILAIETRSCRLQNLIIHNNQAAAAGGGLYTRGDSALVVQNCEIRENNAVTGGAIRADAQTRVQLLQNIVHHNYADSSGGAFYFQSCSPVLKNNRIFYNSQRPTSPIGAGGISCYLATPLIGGSLTEGNDIYDNNGGVRGRQLYVIGKDIIVDARYNYWGALPSTAVFYPDALINYTNYRNVSMRVPLGTKHFYFSPTGNDSNDGASPATAWRTLTFGLPQFFGTPLDSVTVHLLDGVYSPAASGEMLPVKLRSYQSIVSDNGKAIFDGTGSTHVSIFYGSSLENASLQNFTIRNARGGSYGAVHIEGSTRFAVIDCRFENNYGNRGGALALIQTRNGAIQNNIFTQNWAQRGGAIMTRYDTGVMTGNTMTGNHAAAGGAIFSDSSSVTRFEENLFTGNSADTGGVFLITRASPRLYNNRLIYNAATKTAGAIAIDGASSPTLGGRRAGGNDIFGNSAPTAGSQVTRLDPGMTVEARYNYWGAPPDSKKISPEAEFTTANYRNLSYRIPDGTRNFFISPQGDNANLGFTSDSPWKTLDYALQQFFGVSTQVLNIYLAAGTYSLARTSEMFPLRLEDYLNIIGAGADKTILDGENLSSLFVGSNLSSVSLRRLTAKNGKSTTEGGILRIAAGSNITIDSCTFADSRAPKGGAVLLRKAAKVQITNSQFVNNVADTHGGAIYLVGDSVTVANSVFRKNAATGGDGGGLFADSSTVATFAANRLSENSASRGGAIAINRSEGVLQKNSITGNSATTAGGVYLQVIKRSRVGGNDADANDIYANTATGIGRQLLVQNSDSLNARNNYWGDVPEQNFVAPTGIADVRHYRHVSIVVPVGTRNFYFSGSGNNADAGTSAAHPWQTLSHGLARVFGGPSEPIFFHLLAGEISPATGQTFPIQLKSWMTLTGVGIGDSASVLDAGSSNRVLLLQGAQNVSVSKLVITGGKAPANAVNGGGILVLGGADNEFDTVQIFKNEALTGMGGGMAITDGAKRIEIRNSRIEKNRAKWGGGLAVNGADSINILSNFIVENEGIGGGIYLAEGYSLLRKNSFLSNSSPRPGSAIYFGHNARGLVARNEITLNAVTGSDTTAALAIDATANPTIGGSPGLGNDIYENGAGKLGRALVRIGAGGAVLDARYNYFGPDSLSQSIIVPLAQFDVEHTRDVPLAANSIPVVLFASPAPGEMKVKQGASTRFIVSALDYDNDPLTFVWSVNNGGVGNDTTYTMPPRPVGTVDRVRVKITDEINVVLVDWIVETVATTGVEAPDGTLPEVFALSQNYPNPFNPETRIDYNLPHAAWVQASIYNMLGQRIRALIDGQQAGGHYTATWDGRDDSGQSLASGVYFLRFRAGEFFVQRKLLLTR